MKNKDLLAYCHIEKAAGTSIIHILRRLFPLSYVDARPLARGAENFIGARDIELLTRCNPAVACVGGHSVVPYTDIVEAHRQCRFITLLREPVARTVSHYRFWVQRMGRDHTPEEFLRHHVSRNFQVRKLAGKEDLDAAKRTIEKNFLLIGTTEEFDKFLVLLARLLDIPWSRLVYAKKNIADHKKELALPANFREQVAAQNELDSELYRWVRTELGSAYEAQYGDRFENDLEEFSSLNRSADISRSRHFLNAIYRTFYLTPVTGIVRKVNGLPYRGVYAERYRD